VFRSRAAVGLQFDPRQWADGRRTLITGHGGGGGRLPRGGRNGHSPVFETGETIPAEAVLLEYREASGEILTPELFPRADGTTWVCAISTAGPLPVDPADVAPDKGAHARLEALCRNISPALSAAPIKARQACFRPVTEDGLPLIGAVARLDPARGVVGWANAPAPVSIATRTLRRVCPRGSRIAGPGGQNRPAVARWITVQATPGRSRGQVLPTLQTGVR
jgi:hypothetical protein